MNVFHRNVFQELGRKGNPQARHICQRDGLICPHIPTLQFIGSIQYAVCETVPHDMPQMSAMRTHASLLEGLGNCVKKSKPEYITITIIVQR